MTVPDPSTWHEIKRVFHEALSVGADSQQDVLRRECAGNDSLRKAVEEMLAEHAQVQVFDANPAASVGLTGLSFDELDNLPVPERIGPFRIEREIARGGSSVVYLAIQENPKRQIALKVLHPGVVSNSTIRRFAREPEVTARLADHPHIAKVYSAGVDELTSRPYFAMQYVEGTNIVQFACGRELGVAEKVELILQACDAVQFAHSREVIHRDLKPENLVVDASGHVWVLDFGVARLLAAGAPRATLSADLGGFVGTLEYISPEQASPSADTPVTTASDVYSLGAVLCELLTGKPPIPCRELPLLQALVAVTTHRPADLPFGAAGGNKNLVAVVAKSLRKDPNERYGTVSEFAADLRRAVAGQAVAARKESPLDWGLRFVRLHRRAAFASVAAFILVLGSIAWGAVSRLERARADADMAAAMPLALGEMFARASMTQESEPMRRDVVSAFDRPVRGWLRREPRNPRALLAYARLLGAEAGVEPLVSDAKLAQRQRVAEAFRAAYAAAPDLQVAREYAVSVVIVGDVHKELGRWEDANRWYLNAHAIVEEWAAREPAHEGLASDLVWDFMRLADIAGARRAREEAERWLGELESAAERRLAMSPGSPGALFDQMSAMSTRMDVLNTLDRRLPTIEERQTLVRLGERLMDRAPYSSLYAQYHLGLVRALAYAVSLQGGRDDAREIARRATPLAERLVTSDPTNAGIALAATDLSREQASIESQAGKQAEAYAILDRARPLIDTWTASEPNNAEVLHAASGFYATEAAIPFGQRSDLAYHGIADRSTHAARTFRAIERALEYAQRSVELSSNEDHLVDWAQMYSNTVVYADDPGRAQIRATRLPPLIARLEAALLQPMPHPSLGINYAFVLGTPSVVGFADIDRALALVAKLDQLYPRSPRHAMARVMLLTACRRDAEACAEMDRLSAIGVLDADARAECEPVNAILIQSRLP